jgi:hypothetical protein
MQFLMVLFSNNEVYSLFNEQNQNYLVIANFVLCANGTSNNATHNKFAIIKA